ncbi:MAG: hypothetical protein LCH73_13710 [Proteobacteria bacterium]|nr:hypothetical protein [Pseudomonadota bacterium]
MKTTVKTLAALAAMTAMGAVQAQGLPPSIWFDDYCDGFSNIKDVGGGVVTGNYNLLFCGGYYDFLPAVGAGGSVKGVGIDYSSAGFDSEGWAPLFRIYSDNTGVIYWTDGSSSTFTWTAGVVEGVRSGRPAMAPR